MRLRPIPDSIKRQRGFLLNPYRFGRVAGYSDVVLQLHCEGSNGSITITDSAPTPHTMTAMGTATISTDQAKYGSASLKCPEFDASASSVVLLLHGDGSNGSTTITDSSNAARAMTVAGNAQNSTTQQKFGTASLKFDGSGDSIRNTNSSSDFTLGTGDFTIEFWIYFTSAPAGYAYALTIRNTTTGYISTNSGSLSIAASHRRADLWTAGVNTQIGNATAMPTNAWHHIALTRASGTFRFFYDGVQEGSNVAVSHNMSGTVYASLGIDKPDGAGDGGMNGYLDEVRITKGVAKYTANFTPATAPFTVTSSGYVKSASSADFSLGTGDFTIEAWVYYISSPQTSYSFIVALRTATTGYISAETLALSMSAQAKRADIWVSGVATQIGTGAAPTANSWHHVALSRINGTFKYFYDGVQEGADVTPTSKNFANLYVLLGTDKYGDDGTMNGYIDEVRITKGIARYSANFTPPTGPYPDS